MAGMGRRTFAAGEVLTASNVMGYLQDQAVMTFAGTAARGTAIPTPTEGMVTYLADTDTMSFYNGTVWKNIYPALPITGNVVQVVQGLKTDTASIGGLTSTWYDITGLSATITPTSATNKILVVGNLWVGATTATQILFQRTLRGATVIGAGNAGAPTFVGSGMARIADSYYQQPISPVFLDSPATTSATTYKYQLASNDTGTFYVNRSANDTGANSIRVSSSITLIEVTA